MSAELLLVAKGQMGDAVSGLRSLSKEIGDAETKAGKFGTAFGGALAGAGAAGAGLLAKGFADNLDIGAANAKLSAQLGATQEEAAQYGKASSEIYAANWGTSIAEINTTLQSVAQNLGGIGEVGEAEFTKAGTAAQVLADVFGADVGESAKAAGQLIKNGLAANATEAFDILGAGFRDGADRSGDFLETITEYSPQFAKLGFSGGQALALIEDGLQAGAKDADVIADAFKEFSLRAIDGSKTTSEAYKALGVDAKQTAADIAAGGPAANLATQEVLASLNNIKDPLQQNQIGVALFGTQWEDTLRQILPAVSELGDASDTVADSIQSIGDTAGGSAKGQIESLQRGFESWTQNMAASHGSLGLVVTGLSTFGGSALATGAQVGQIVTGLGSLNLASKAATIATNIQTGAQWLLNAAMSANPIGLVILAIVALVAIFVIAWKNSETFRNIVTGAFNKVLSGVQTAWNWIKGNWPLLLAILTGPIGLAVRSIIKHKDEIVAAFKAIPGKIKEAFSNANNLLADAGRRVIQGFIDAITGAFGKVRDTLSRLTGLLPDWKGPKQVDLKILAGPGQWVMQGFRESLESGYSDVERSLRGFSGDLPDAIRADFQPAAIAAQPVAATGAQVGGVAPEVVVHFNGTFDLASDADRRRAARLIRDEIVKLEGAAR